MKRSSNSKQRRRMVSIIRERDGDNCWVCGKYMRFPEIRKMNPFLATLDHVRPLYDGGADKINNIRLAHLRCNTRRRAMDGHRPDPNGNAVHRFSWGGKRHRYTRYWEMFSQK